MTATIERVKFSNLVCWTPKQKEADAALRKFKYVLYGGAMGGGKSYWLRWELLHLLLYYHARYEAHGVVTGLFCENYPALKDRQLSKISTEFPDWLGIHHTDHKDYGNSFILAPEYGSGVIAFRNLDDTSKYQSAEFAAIAPDELTKNQFVVFNDLRNRLRWPGIPASEWKFLAATNPGSIGHAWVKKYWIDRDFPPEEAESAKFVYIPALAKDNPYLDADYLRQLESLPEETRRAYLEGDWNIFKGQYFTEWRNEIHTRAPYTIPAGWERFVSIDYGYAKPSSVHWWAVDYDGNLTAYRELYVTGHTFQDLARAILTSTPIDEDVRYWVADPAIWNKSGETELSGAELMYEVASKLNRSIALVKANNDRLTGWRVLREYLKPFEVAAKKTAALTFFTTCTNAVRTIPALVYDPIRTEDLDTDGEDHAADDTRYAVMSRPQKPDRPALPKDHKGEIWDAVQADLQRISEPTDGEDAWG
jgi:phage terminase large subunit